VKEIDLSTPQGAIFSDDGKYRYSLWRLWSQVRPMLLFIGLNPSTASSSMNDPTITRLMVRANNEGFGGLLAANLYALVSTNPNALLSTSDSIGPETDEYLQRLIRISGKVMCGWGSFAAAMARSTAVLRMIPEPWCLGINSDGQPKHPLYMKYDTPIVRYEVKR
jgi:hypothetical protein